MASRGRPPPPPLPPRGSHDAQDDAPPPYDLVEHQHRALEKAAADSTTSGDLSLMHNDPRASSQDSLAPASTEQDRKRTLLLIFIHGFMGNETSFRSFPAHVHNLMTVLIGETHVVHTKVYPRYRSRGNIRIARDAFSAWLAPHESNLTDVVLLGHSMGGLLAAEIALMPATQPGVPLKHTILGTVNLDVPFLGMHPGIVKSGLASIFKPAEEPDDKWEDQPQLGATSSSNDQVDHAPTTPEARVDTLWGKNDPNYNPKFANDVALPIRKGWRNAWHFVNKHSDNLVQSTKTLVASHMEFGGAMAKYGELKTRYARIRALEEEDGRVRQSVVDGGTVPRRVRFVNYYTASTGRPKRPVSSSRPSSQNLAPSRPGSTSSNSRKSLNSVDDADVNVPQPDTTYSGPSEDGLSKIDHVSSGGNSGRTERGDTARHNAERVPREHSKDRFDTTATLPDLPPAPPALGDLSYIADESVRKLVVNEHAKAVERYKKALDERERALQPGQGYNGQPRAEVTVGPSDSQNLQANLEKPKTKLTHAETEALRLQNERERMKAEQRRLQGKVATDTTIAERSADSIPRIESRAPSMPASVADTASASAYEVNRLTPQQSTQSTNATSSSDSGKPKKDRKFCNLPPKDKNGQLDPCWVRVFMENVDEVGAHCGLFFINERYERLVGEVADRIEQWVLTDHGSRVPGGTSSQPRKLG